MKNVLYICCTIECSYKNYTTCIYPTHLYVFTKKHVASCQVDYEVERKEAVKSCTADTSLHPLLELTDGWYRIGERSHHHLHPCHSYNHHLLLSEILRWNTPKCCIFKCLFFKENTRLLITWSGTSASWLGMWQQGDMNWRPKGISFSASHVDLQTLRRKPHSYVVFI